MNQSFHVAGIGELLWDVFPSGKQVGGAPLNFAFHAAQLGCRASIVTALGKDPFGDELLQATGHLGVDMSFVQRNSYPTGTVDITLDARGVPTYDIRQGVAWDHIESTQETSVWAATLDAVCFGTLAQRHQLSHRAILSILNALPFHCLRVFDVNLRQNYYSPAIILESLDFTDVLKLNEDELPVVADLFKIRGSSVLDIAYRLIDRLPIRYLILTLGARGSSVFHKIGRMPNDSADSNSRTIEISSLPAPATAVVDTVGAGDAFSAAFTVALLKGEPLEKAHRLASQTAAFLCTKNGATPALPNTILSLFS